MSVKSVQGRSTADATRIKLMSSYKIWRHQEIRATCTSARTT